MKDFLHHLFIPRESNNFRAKLLHHTSLFLLIISLFAGSFLFTAIQRNHSDVLGVSAASVSIPQLLSLTNKERQAHGLSPLLFNQELTQAATAKADFMFQKNFWAHNSPDGITPWVFVKNANYPYVYAGENLARGFNTANDVINAWMASPGHRENMLSPNYKDIGFAVQAGSLTGEETILVVEMLGNTTQAKTVSAGVNGAAITPIPSPTPEQPSQQTMKGSVVSAQNPPLINKKPLTKHLALFIVTLLAGVLLVDIIIIERKKIKRAFSHTHNIDLIIYLCVLIILIYILTKGAIL